MLEEIIPFGLLEMKKNLDVAKRCNSVMIGENLIFSTIFLPLSPWNEESTMIFFLGEDFQV